MQWQNRKDCFEGLGAWPPAFDNSIPVIFLPKELNFRPTVSEYFVIN